MRAILTYHSIDPSGSAVSVAEEDFRRHASFLASGRVPVVPLEELWELPAATDALAITFDDAFESFATRAWPHLAGHALPVTLFVVTEHAGGTNAWGGRSEPGVPELPLLDWDALGRLAGEGVSIGAHSRRHRALPGLDHAALEDEVAGSAERIETELGVKPRSFAYPYGAFDAEAVASVRELYECAVTTELRWLHDLEDRHVLPRVDAYYLRAAGRLEAWGTPGMRRYLRLRARLRRWRALCGMAFGRRGALRFVGAASSATMERGVAGGDAGTAVGDER